MTDEWQYIEDEDLRDQCDHIWRFHFTDIENREVHTERRCEREGKYRNGDTIYCGYHTPGVGRKGPRRVPRQLSATRDAEG